MIYDGSDSLEAMREERMRVSKDYEVKRDEAVRELMGVRSSLFDYGVSCAEWSRAYHEKIIAEKDARIAELIERVKAAENLYSALDMTRGQWIHSVNKDACLSALEEYRKASEGKE